MINNTKKVLRQDYVKKIFYVKIKMYFYLFLMKIKIKEEKCVGCGRCTELCPKTFRLKESGKAEVISEEDILCAGKASDTCPTEAIEIEE